MTTFPIDVWYQICTHLSVKSLCMLRAVSQEIRSAVDSRGVWFPVMSNLTEGRSCLYSKMDIEGMSATELRKACVRMIVVSRAYASPHLPHRKVFLSFGVEVRDVHHVLLLPKGERMILVKKDGDLEVHSIANREIIWRVTPPAHDGWTRRRWSTYAKLFPTSLHSGYLVVKGTDDFSQQSPVLRVYTLHVYRYSEREVQHVITEEIPTTVYEGYGFCAHEGSLHLLHIRRLGPDRITRSFEKWLRVVDPHGNSHITKQQFVLAEPFEDIMDNNAARHILYVLSPRYVLVEVETRTKVLFELFDLNQIRDEGGPTIIHPIWLCPHSLNICSSAADRPRITLRCVDDRIPSVRVCFGTYAPRAFNFLDLPALHDISTEHGINLSSVQFPEGTPDSIRYDFMEYQSFEYGLVLMYEDVRRERPLRPTTEYLWSFAAPWWQRHSIPGMLQPGLIELDEPDASNVFTPRLGNTSIPLEDNNDTDWYSVDDVSGRFTSSAPQNGGGQGVGILLYTLDDEHEKADKDDSGLPDLMSEVFIDSSGLNSTSTP